MNLSSLVFWDYLVIALLFFVLIGAYRLAVALGRTTERFVAWLVGAGMHGLAKSTLGLVGYDHRTYAKSRFIVWNQVTVRFSLLWGGLIGWATVLFILREGRTIHSIAPFWILGIVLYLACRWYLSLKEEKADSQTDDILELLESLNSVHSREKGQSNYPHSRPVPVRQWDYLDELFHV